MRTSYSWFAVLLMALAVTGCPKKDDASKDDDKSEGKSKKKKKGGDDDGDDDDKGKKKKKKGDDDGDDDKGKKKKKGDDDDDKGGATSKKSATGPFSASFEENKDIKMPFGKAYPSFYGMHVVLSNEKTKCNSYGSPSDESYEISFDLPPGPGGKFYAGKPVGVKASWKSEKIKLKLTYANAYHVTANIDPFKAKEGGKLKGSLDFDLKYEETKADTSKKVHSYSAGGTFEVDICDDPFNNLKKLTGQPEEAGEGEVQGTFAGDKFKAKSVLAHIYNDKINGLDYVSSIEFFDTEDVTCSTRWDAYKKATYLKVDYPAGASSKQKLTGSPQPVDFASISKPAPGKTFGNVKFFGGSGGSHGWVNFDKLEFKGGGTLKGKLYVESGADAKPEEQGKMTGSFEAKVCAMF